MPEGQFKDGIAGGRLAADQYAENFSDLHPPLDHHEALVESDRCYFCYDAPCMNCLLYTSPSPRDGLLSRMPSSA